MDYRNPFAKMLVQRAIFTVARFFWSLLSVFDIGRTDQSSPNSPKVRHTVRWRNPLVSLTIR